MSENTFTDALAGSVVTIGEASFGDEKLEGDGAAQGCTSLFYPGCSFTNFAPELLIPLYRMLKDRGQVDGVSFICCGKILKFEPDAKTVKPAFQEQLADVIVARGIERMVVACPNCIAELRAMREKYENLAGLEIALLPEVLLECGIAVSHDDIRTLLQKDERLKDEEVPKLSIHDSCPDRRTGELARSTRKLFPPEVLHEMEHNYARSICCGALANAAGRPDVAKKQAISRGEEARAAHATSIVTYCMSCAHMLGHNDIGMPVHHYLEFVTGIHVDWASKPEYMAYRLLFEELQGKRNFLGVG